MNSGTEPRCSGSVNPCATSRASASHTAAERSSEFLRLLEYAVRTSVSAISSTSASSALRTNSRVIGSSSGCMGLLEPQMNADEPDRIVLRSVSWATYECLLADHHDRSAPRFTYDRGTLEIMSPVPEHEEVNRALASVVENVAVEWRM